MAQVAGHDITNLVSTVDSVLERTEDRLHRQILENFRRHALLEVSGKMEKIFEPNMMVEDPHYLITDGDTHHDLQGSEEVKAFYEDLRESGDQVMYVDDDMYGAFDGGFAHFWTMNHYFRGENLIERGVDEDIDPDGYYIQRYREIGVWPYDERGRCMGEWVARITPKQNIQVSEEEFITPVQAREKLEPLIRPLPDLPEPK